MLGPLEDALANAHGVLPIGAFRCGGGHGRREGGTGREEAHNDYIGAVFNHKLAKVSLARAMGSTNKNISQVLNRK
jgi:hypothetical protein